MLGEFSSLSIFILQEPIFMLAHIQNIHISKISIPEIFSSLSSEENMFTAYIENLYLTKSQEGIQIMLYSLLGKSRQQESIIIMAKIQNFYISKMSVPEIQTNISSQEEISSVVESPKDKDYEMYYLVPDTFTIFEEYGLSYITKSVSETRPSKSNPSILQNSTRMIKSNPSGFGKSTQLIKAASCRQIMYCTCQVFMAEDLGTSW